MPRGLISELEEAAAAIHKLAPFEVSGLLDRAVDMVRELRKQAPESTVNRGLIIYLRTASAGAARLAETETMHALLDAADALRIFLEKNKRETNKVKKQQRGSRETVW